MLTHFLYSQSLLVAVAMLVSVLGPADGAGRSPTCRSASRACAQAGAPGGAHRAARRAGDGAAVRAVPAHRPALGRAAGRHLDAPACRTRCRWARSPSSRSTTAIAMRVRFDGAGRRRRRDVLPRPGADPLRRPRVAPARPAVRAGRLPRGRRRCSASGTPVRYEVTLEPLRLPSLPLLEATTEVAPRSRATASVARDDLQWLADRPVFERLRFKAQRHHALRSWPAAPLRRAARIPRAAARLQPAHARLGARAARRAARRGASATALADGAAAAHPQRRLQLHARARRLRPRRDRRVLARSQGRLLRALRRGLRRRDARDGRAGARRHRLPGHRPAAGRRLLRRAPELRPRLGRVLADRAAAGCAPTRPARSRPIASAAAPGSRRSPGFVAGALDAMSPELFASLRSGWEAINNRWNQWVLNYIARPAARPAEAPRLRLAELGRPGAAADRRAERRWRSPARPGPGGTGTASIRGCASSSGCKRALRALGVAAAPHDAPRALAARVRERLGAARRAARGALLDALELQRYSRARGERARRRADARFAAEARRLRAPAPLDNRGDAPFARFAARCPRRRQPRRARRRPPPARCSSRSRRAATAGASEEASAAAHRRWRSATTALPTSSPTASATT